MKRLLIANRGEIARRIIRTAHAMGIQTVAVYSDADAQALHVREATAGFALQGNASADTYLRIDKIIAAAQATGADAIHPGYGFLSENADFAQAVLDTGLIWVGPPPAATRALGSKSNAKALAQTHGVPTLPGYQGQDQSDERFAAEAQQVGYPVMVKATAGGGGRGMRRVLQAADLKAALASARTEAKSAFGSDELLIERALLAPRHVEIQVFADTWGNCIHLGERDCSMQRRNQKIIEEAPSPAVDAALRSTMGACAVNLAQAAGYVGAGTVEFLLQDGEFFLMEMNTRLQVEHPVTECLTGLDLVAWQLKVARGEPLPLAQQDVRFEGHAMELRICAEDERFAPQTGRIEHVGLGNADGVRWDHALYSGAQVSPHYDSMVAKCISHAPGRAQAIAKLQQALANTQLLGLPTNVGMLQACLADPVFARGEALVPHLEGAADGLREQIKAAEAQTMAGALAALHGLMRSEDPRGLHYPHAKPMRLRWCDALVSMHVMELGQCRILLAAQWGEQEVECEVTVQRLDASRVQVSIAGAQHVWTGACVDAVWCLQGQGLHVALIDETFEPLPSANIASVAINIVAPLAGKVIAVNASAGAAVTAGETVILIESMKLEHHVLAPRRGVIEQLLVEVGQQVSPRQVLATYSKDGS
jgi:geranyl-CoA carboxylase alpha subunit